MDTNPTPYEAIVSRSGSDTPQPIVDESSKIGRYLVRLLVIVFAMGLGGITALLIGLFTGWIPFIVC